MEAIWFHFLKFWFTFFFSKPSWPIFMTNFFISNLEIWKHIPNGYHCGFVVFFFPERSWTHVLIGEVRREIMVIFFGKTNLDWSNEALSPLNLLRTIHPIPSHPILWIFCSQFGNFRGIRSDPKISEDLLFTTGFKHRGEVEMVSNLLVKSVGNKGTNLWPYCWCFRNPKHPTTTESDGVTKTERK